MSDRPGKLVGMTSWSLTEIEAAVRATWAADTCSPDDEARFGWGPENPALGHCDITALVVNDLFGGDLVVAEVFRDGEQEGYHWWNRLDNGLELDLTRDQFQLGQTLSAVRVVARPVGPTRRRHAEYLVFRERLSRRLNPLPTPNDGITRPTAPASAPPGAAPASATPGSAVPGSAVPGSAAPASVTPAQDAASG